MTLELPKPIAIYFASENARDTDAIEDCFAPEGAVHDEGEWLRGFDAIKAWRRATAEKYAHTVEPLELAGRDGKTVVTARVTGNFPGSPVELDHVFELAGDRIATLEIH